jgi:hypothetical protein
MQQHFKAEEERRWHSETTILENILCERRAAENLVFDRKEFEYNFRAERLPQPRRVESDVWGRATSLQLDSEPFCRTREAPVHPALANKSGWDSTVTVDGPRLAATLTATTARARSASHARTARSTAPSLVGRETSCMQTLRGEREAALLAANDEGTKRLAREATLARGDKLGFLNTGGPLREHYTPAVPAPSLASIAATALERSYVDNWESAEEARQATLALTKRDRISVRFVHSGSYGPLVQAGAGKDSDDEDGGGQGWSCCGAGPAAAKGCVVLKRDLDRHQLGGI